jgi:hypothetical protein
VTEIRVEEMAHKAAELLPEPPAAHDPFGYLAWEELVVSTARRLQWLMGDAEPSGSVELPVTLTLQPGTARLDGQALLTLARLLAAGDDTACEGVLTQAVTTCQGGSVRTEPHGRHQRHPLRRRPAHARLSSRGVAVAPRV